MTKEEVLLHNRVGRPASFKVPDGYFEGLAFRVMDSIPENDTRVIAMRPSFWARLPFRKIAAAISAAVVLGAGGWYALGHASADAGKMAHTQRVAEQEENVLSSEYGTFDQMADYAMIDNETIYASLLAEN